MKKKKEPVISLQRDKRTLKQECEDLFENINLEKIPNKQEKVRQVMVKMKRQKLEKAIIKLELCIALKAISGLVYLRAVLMRIKFFKEIFILDIAEGQEVFIPKALSQSHYPYSYRYYDPILALININTPDEKIQFFTVQRQVAFNIHRQTDMKQKVFEYLGIYESD